MGMRDLVGRPYIVVQGNLESSRRDYATLIKWLVESHVAAQHPRLRILLPGKLLPDSDIRTSSFGIDLLLKDPALRERVLMIPFSTHVQYSTILEHARAVFAAQHIEDMSYVNYKSSSTIPTTISQNLPLIADYRVDLAYGQPVTGAVIEYRNPNILATPGELQDNSVPSSSGTLASFETFDEAVDWVLQLTPSEFKDVRRKVLALREQLFLSNTNLVASAIHNAQVEQVVEYEYEYE